MRQTTMDRWIEAAEANRFCQIAQQTLRAINGADAADQLAAIEAPFDGAARDPTSMPGSRRRNPVERVGVAAQEHAAE